MADKIVKYSDKMQKGYRYTLSDPVGKNFDSDFKPELTPKQMLKLGVFGGAYFIGAKGGIPKDLPENWFKGVKLSSDNEKDAKYNYFKLRASQPLQVWRAKGWIWKDDPHGWFQWYCRYYIGRRVPKEDARQIKRWKAFARHAGQVKKNCREEDLNCRRKQRQALLHWAYDSRKI